MNVAVLRRLSTETLRRAALAVLFACSAYIMAPVQPVLAQGGDLAVAPTRVVFEGRSRSAQLSLVNRGSTTATYRIQVVNMRMDENGQMQRIDQPDAGQNFAGNLFRYSPRQVTLAPGETQAVRLLLRKPANLADGEYRSHLLMQNVPKDAGVSIEQNQSTDGVQIRMVPIFGITIPVIVRHGNTQANVSLSDLNIMPPDAESAVPRLRFNINREGSGSAFGDLTAKLVAGGKETVIGQIMRLAIYTPNTSRGVTMSLRVPAGASLSGGKLHLTYARTEDDGGKPMADAELTLP